MSMFFWCGSLSHCPFCRWIRNCKHSSFGSGSRTPLQLGLGTVVWSARVRLLYSHLPKRSAPRGETNLSSIRTKQDRCEYSHPSSLTLSKTEIMQLFTYILFYILSEGIKMADKMENGEKQFSMSFKSVITVVSLSHDAIKWQVNKSQVAKQKEKKRQVSEYCFNHTYMQFIQKKCHQ